MQVTCIDKASAFGKKYQDWMAAIFLVLVVLGFFYKTVLFGKLPIPSDDLVGLYHPWRDAYAHTFQNGVPYKNFLITDPIRQQIPWRKQVIDSVKRGKLPLWDATSFSGTPLLGNIQSGAFYPFNFLFFLFPFAVAWSVLIISQPLLAGIFLYLFLRHKKVIPLGALVGSICFSFSGFSIAWLTWGTIGSTILWLPLILLSFDRMHTDKRKMYWRLLFIFSVVSAFFAGHIQVFFYSMLVFSLYAIWSFRNTKPNKMYLMHVITPVVILILTSPVWMRFISVYMTSSRASGSMWEGEGFFIPVRHLLQFVAPDFFGNPATLNYWGVWNYGEMVGYIGIVGLILAVVGIAKETGFWVMLAALCLVFAVEGPVARLPYIWHIPFLSSLQPTRLLSIVDFSLSILAAYGMADIVKQGKKRLIIGLLTVGILFGFAWLSYNNPALLHVSAEQLEVMKRNLMLPTAVYAAVLGIFVLLVCMKRSWSMFRNTLCFGLLALLTFEIIRFGWKFTPFTDGSYFFPKTETIETLMQIKKPFRVLATDDRLLPPNVLSFYNIESASGYDPIYSARYEEYIAAMERGEPNIKPPFGFNRIITPKTITSPLLSFLNVNYIVSMDSIASADVRLLGEEGTTKLYTVIHKVPRVYFAETLFFENAKDAVIRRLYTKECVPGKCAVLESAPFTVGEISAEDTVEIENYDGDNMTLHSSSKHLRFLVIGNMMDSHWRVLIDGKNAPILRTNYIFFGVVVPDGTHTIAVQYK